MIFPYAKIKRIWTCKGCGKDMCVTCNLEAHSLDLPCVSETKRAQNARFYAQFGTERPAISFAKAVAGLQGPLRRTNIRITGPSQQKVSNDPLVGIFTHVVGL